MADREHRYGVGERTDGTLDTFPMSEWPARREELRAMLAGETDADDLGDLGDVEKLFELPKGMVSKVEAEYVEPWAEEATQCDRCTMFVDAGSCTLVAGDIAPFGHCKKFDAKGPDEDEGAEDEFNEAAHPRGQPDNAGEFASVPGGGSKKADGGGVEKPPTEKQFYRNYSQHVDIRGREKGNAEETARSIAENGFQNQFGNVNTLPPYRGGAPSNIVEQQYAPHKGDIVYLVPNSELRKTPNGMVIKDGWKPKPNEIIRVKSDRPSMYQEFLKASAPAEGAKPDIRKSMNKVTEVAASTQPVKSLDELYERAQAEEPAFRKMVEDIAEVTGSKAKLSPEVNGSTLKTRESTERKLKDELGGDFTKVRDVLRGTVVGDSVEKTRDAAATFIAKQGDNILRVKDRHVGPQGSGYRDILVNFRTPGGLVAELQFNSKAMVTAKESEGHKLYDEMRTGKLAGKSFDELQAAAKAIYDKAYLDDGDGHWEMT